MTEVQAIIFGAVIGGFIGIFATYFAYRLNRNMTLEALRIAAFNKAAIDFFEAFLPTIMSLDERYHLEDINNFTVREIIEKDLPRQISAMLRFRLYLPTNKIESFNEAWRVYCRYDVNGEPKVPQPAQYEEKTLQDRPTAEVALERIKNLLKVIDDIHPFLLNLDMKD